jgi:hypothetical protein
MAGTVRIDMAGRVALVTGAAALVNAANVPADTGWHVA